jgi:ceramide glucosyltransferase
LDIVMLPLRDLLIYALWLATFLRRGIEWRGHTLPAPRQFGASL